MDAGNKYFQKKELALFLSLILLSGSSASYSVNLHKTKHLHSLVLHENAAAPLISRDSLFIFNSVPADTSHSAEDYSRIFSVNGKKGSSPDEQAATYRALDDSDMAENLSEALTFTKYPTWEQYDSMMHYFASNYPDICRVDTFGYSKEGRLLLAVKISDHVQSREDEPAFLYTSTMHGDELVGYVLTLRLISFILESYGQNIEVDRLVDDLEIWINPLSNPDYTYYSGNSTVANSTRPYNDALNLNRNFPDPSSGDKNDTTGIIKENQAMMLFMMKHQFNLSANIHSGEEVVNYPWDFTYNLHPDDDWYRFISREYADVARDVNPEYMNNFIDGITNGAKWYVIYGGRQDYVNYYLHGREVTLELSMTKKLPSEYLDSYWNYNKWSLLNYMAQARYGIHGNVRNSSTGSPVGAEIRVINHIDSTLHDDSTSWVISDPFSGNFYRYLKEGVYDLVVSAEEFFTDTIYEVEVRDYFKTEVNIELDSTGASDTGRNIHSEQAGSSQGVHLYPNPAGELATLVFDEATVKEADIELYSLTGSLVRRYTIAGGAKEFQLNLSGIEAGFYEVFIRQTGKTNALRLIIQ